MQIIGMQKNSFIDYPAKISCVVFTPGCNMNCWYCHNREIINENEGAYDENQVLEFLKKRAGFLDAVVVSGGEATLQPDLIEFIRKVKDMGYLVKLDTNGSNPEILNKLIEDKLVDYVAMDIKAPFEKYNIITPINPNILENVKKSVSILKSSNIDYEFRTTFAPNLSNEDIKCLLEKIAPVKNFSLQMYMKPKFIKEDKLENHKSEDFEEIKKFAIDGNLVQNFQNKNLS